MSRLVYVPSVLLALGFILILFFSYRDTAKGDERPLYSRTPAFTPKIEPRLVNDENRRCEGKIHTSPVSQELKLRQYARKKHVRDMCIKDSPLENKSKWQTFDQIPQQKLNNLLVDDRHGIIYCYVPKVACTKWKRLMIVLSESLKVHGVPYKNPDDIPIELVHGYSLQQLNAYPKEVIKQKLDTYTKFLFVRDPFVRLISAYKDKLGGTNQIYYQTVGKEILRRFGNVTNPPTSVQKAHEIGIVPSFHGFIQFILSLPAENDAAFDEHWRQMVHLCHPCLIDYEFIGKMETVYDDAAQLLRMLYVDNVVSFERSQSKTEPGEIKTWFADIPVEWRKKLHQIYEADFKLFGYETHEDMDNLDD